MVNTHATYTAKLFTSPLWGKSSVERSENGGRAGVPENIGAPII